MKKDHLKDFPKPKREKALRDAIERCYKSWHPHIVKQRVAGYADDQNAYNTLWWRVRTVKPNTAPHQWIITCMAAIALEDVANKFNEHKHTILINSIARKLL